MPNLEMLRRGIHSGTDPPRRSSYNRHVPRWQVPRPQSSFESLLVLFPMSSREVWPIKETSAFGKAVLGHHISGKAFVGVTKIERLAALDVVLHLVA